MSSHLVDVTSTASRYRALTRRDIPALAQRYGIGDSLRDEISVVSQVVPFRVNGYVLDNLIDWNAVPDDPIFRMLFPSADMLAADDFAALAAAGTRAAAVAREIQSRLNPQPGGTAGTERRLPRQ